MSQRLHPSLTPEKWSKFPKPTQILNIASELSRTRGWLGKQRPEPMLNSFDRAFELIDLTIADPKWRRGLKELLRFREQLAALYIQNKHDINYFNLLLRAWLNFNGETARVEI